MPLTPTGHYNRRLDSTSFRAIDGGGRIVIVEASQEALDDFGRSLVWMAADRKYEAGQFDNSTPRVVRVRSDDCIRD